MAFYITVNFILISLLFTLFFRYLCKYICLTFIKGILQLLHVQKYLNFIRYTFLNQGFIVKKLLVVNLLIFSLFIINSNITPYAAEELAIFFIINKKPIRLYSNIKLTNQIRFMKRFPSSFCFSLVQKRNFAKGIQFFFFCHFNTPIKTLEDIIERNWIFYQSFILGENVFKQTLSKSIFPKIKASKQTFLSLKPKNNLDTFSSLENKISIQNPKEISDIRFYPEYLTVQRLSYTSNQITNIIMQDETPINANANITKTNGIIEFPSNIIKTSVITESASKRQGQIDTEFTIVPQIAIATNQQELIYKFYADIKAGNNMFKPFSHIIGELWIKNKESYTIMNNEVTIEDIQNLRLKVLTAYPERNFKNLSLDQKEIFNEFFAKFKSILSLEMSEINKNELIQEEFFKIMSFKLPNLQSSFYVISQVQESFIFNENFEARLLEHITPEVFNNYENLYKFIKIGIKIYNEELGGLIKNIENSNSSFFEGTGFANITKNILDD